MKLLFILPEYLREPVGGIRSFYVNLLPGLARAGFGVKVLLARREFADMEGFVDESGVEVEYVRADMLAKHDKSYQMSQYAGNWLLGEFLPVANAAFEQARAGEGYDLVEVTDWPLIFFPWCAQKIPQTSFTVSLHSSMGQMFEYDAQRGNNLDKCLIRMFEVLCFSSAPIIHANSNLNARYWEKITNRKVDVLLPMMAKVTESLQPMAEDGSKMANGSKHVSCFPTGDALDNGRSPLDSAPLATSYPTPAIPRLCGAVFARLQNLKGCEILAEALAECPNIEIHWYGSDMGNTADGEMWSKSLAAKFPEVFGRNFIYHGVVAPDRVLDLMAEVDFVCVPSLWDVFNLSAVEAMESAKIVLCSRQAGAEMLIEDGVNGFLFEPDQAGELAAKLQQIVHMTPEERERIGCVARESVREKLHPERLVQQRIAYYRSVAAQKPEENRNCFLADIFEPKPVAVKTWGRRIYELRQKIGI